MMMGTSLALDASKMPYKEKETTLSDKTSPLSGIQRTPSKQFCNKLQQQVIDKHKLNVGNKQNRPPLTQQWAPLEVRASPQGGPQGSLPLSHQHSPGFPNHQFLCKFPNTLCFKISDHGAPGWPSINILSTGQDPRVGLSPTLGSG